MNDNDEEDHLIRGKRPPQRFVIVCTHVHIHILYDFQDLSEVRLEVEGEEVGGQILPHFYCEDMMNVMNKVIVLLMLLVMSMVVVTVL